MAQPMSPPPPPMPPAAAPAKNNNATVALVLGIVGVLCCPICAPIAWIMGKKEVDAVKAGRSPAGNQGLAMAGFILGIIGTIFFAFWLVWMLFFGGMAFLSALSGAGS